VLFCDRGGKSSLLNSGGDVDGMGMLISGCDGVDSCVGDGMDMLSDDCGDAVAGVDVDGDGWLGRSKAGGLLRFGLRWERFRFLAE
jgi:hypothetical protein